MLIGAIELMKADGSNEHRNLFVQELCRAEFMCPAIFTPAPVKGEDGEIKPAPGSKVHFPMLTTTDGKTFLGAFTDRREFEGWKKEGMYPVAMSVKEYAAMLAKKDSPAAGLVINPGSTNLALPKEMLLSVLAAEMTKKEPADQ